MLAQGRVLVQPWAHMIRAWLMFVRLWRGRWGARREVWAGAEMRWWVVFLRLHHHQHLGQQACVNCVPSVLGRLHL